MLNWLFKSFRKPKITHNSNELFLLECQLHGSHYYGCHSLLKKEQLFVGEPLILRRETDNEYDKNAIQICATIESIFPSAWEPITITIVMRLK